MAEVAQEFADILPPVPENAPAIGPILVYQQAGALMFKNFDSLCDHMEKTMPETTPILRKKIESSEFYPELKD